MNPGNDKILIKNGAVLDACADGKILDILINGAEIERMAARIEDTDAATVIDADGRLVVPGLIDAHVHFREPGQGHKETIYTGSCAAAAGGFTTVIAEPNTFPPIDTPLRLKNVLNIAKRMSVVNYLSKACITSGQRGKRIADTKALKGAGAVAISDDGHPVPGRVLMRHALQRGAISDILVTPHCEESEYYRDNMRKAAGRRMATSGAEPYMAEAVFVERDIEEAERTGARIHISHVSLAASVQIIAGAKERGVKVSAEAAPHHFLLSRHDVAENDANAKVNPPLRSKEDVRAVQTGLSDGTIDVIASDHAPHTQKEKRRPYGKAPFGVIGLETTLGLVLTHLVTPGILTINQAIEKLTLQPARIFGLANCCGKGRLAPGGQADITIIDLSEKWRVDVDRFYSKARNCPFDNWQLQGKAVMTIVGGKVVMRDGVVVEE